MTLTNKLVVLLFLYGSLGGCLAPGNNSERNTPEQAPVATIAQPTPSVTISPSPSLSPVAPSETPSPNPTSTTVVDYYFEELPGITLLGDTELIASSSHPGSKIPDINIHQGENVQVIGSDVNSAWLLVLYKNTLGWIPSVLSSGVGVLDTLTLVESQIVYCKTFYGVVNQPSEAWEIKNDGNEVVQGLLYLPATHGNIDDIVITLIIEERGQEESLRIEQSAIDAEGGLFLFTSLLKDLKSGEHVHFRLEGVDEAAIPFQASYFSDDCGEEIASFTASPSNAPPPMATRVIHIQSTAVPAPITVGAVNYCPGGPAIRVQINDLARVTYTDGTPLRLRKEPKIVYSNIIRRLPEGTEIKIFSGPVCVGSYAFWYVRVKDTDIKGWVAEGDKQNYYIETILRPQN